MSVSALFRKADGLEHCPLHLFGATLSFLCFEVRLSIWGDPRKLFTRIVQDCDSAYSRDIAEV